MGVLVLLLSLAVLLWGVWPMPQDVRQVALAAGEMKLTLTTGAVPTAAPADVPGDAPGSAGPAVPEKRLLVIEHPQQIRSGDSGLILLTLEMDQQGQLTATAQMEDGQVIVEPVEIPNVYDTHHVVAEARLDMAGMEYRPEGVISEALLPGRAVKFIWSVRPAEYGTYHGTVWLHLRFVPLAGGPETRNVISAQRVTIEGTSLLGLKGATARVAGSVGSVLGSLLGLDGVLEWLWKRLLRSKKRIDEVR